MTAWPPSLHFLVDLGGSHLTGRWLGGGDEQWGLCGKDMPFRRHHGQGLRLMRRCS